MRGTPFPPYVQSDEQRRRWDQCVLLTLALCAANGADPGVTATFLVLFVRAVYHDATYTTGTAEELAEMKEMALRAGLIPR